MSIAPYEIRTEVPTCAATEALVGLAAVMEYRRDQGIGAATSAARDLGTLLYALAAAEGIEIMDMRAEEGDGGVMDLGVGVVGLRDPLHGRDHLRCRLLGRLRVVGDPEGGWYWRATVHLPAPAGGPRTRLVSSVRYTSEVVAAQAVAEAYYAALAGAPLPQEERWLPTGGLGVSPRTGAGT